ncbi:hydroxyacylglutathione hydrolase [Bradyrhizobium ottawaense]|uniref:hydroxyacylglutathione hydrolase n=1 Tax=Bradyrhizobium ottawaense TaxID=931866 RepID=UPI00383249D6
MNPSLEVHQFSCLADNIGILVHDPKSGATAAIDAPDGAPIVAALNFRGWCLTDVLLTHHHNDHVQGLGALKARYPTVRVVGAAGDRERLPTLDLALHDGDVFAMGQSSVSVIATPGHTAYHLAYYFSDEAMVFTGDALFSLGCGRVLETSMEVAFNSLQRIAALPPATLVYCGHDYTHANARFAISVNPTNEALRARFESIVRALTARQSTLPTTIAEELAANPFLRVSDPEIRQNLGMPDGHPSHVFAALRELKNRS